MSAFKNLRMDDQVEDQVDASGGRHIFDTGAYETEISMAYFLTSQGGAMGIHFRFDIDGQEYRETVYMTNRQGKNYYEKDGVKHYLPGFNIVNAISAVTLNQEIADTLENTIEERPVKVWNSDAKEEVATDVPVITGLIGEKLIIGLEKTLESRTKQEGGEYVPTGETFNSNRIARVFELETKKTYAELRDGKDASQFTAWTERNTAETVIDRTIKDTNKAGSKGAPKAAAKRSSGMFGNKK